MVLGSLMILGGGIVAALAATEYISGREEGVFELLGTLLTPLLFIVFGCVGILSAVKRAEVHRGKIIYHTGFRKKEYRMSDLKTSKIETDRTAVCYEDTAVVEESRKKIVFYDQTGKRVFQFGEAYCNTERLRADAKNAQRSIAGQKEHK